MQHPPEKPTIADRVNSIDYDDGAKPRHNTLRNKMRLWAAKAQQATHSSKVGGVGQPRRRPKPSMPQMPWDESK